MKGTTLAPLRHARSTVGKTRTSRLAFATALMFGATLAMSGCGAQQAGAAAIVDGRVISDQEVQSVSDQLNAVAKGGGAKLKTSDALLSLILAPYVLAEAERTGKTVAAAQARQAVPSVVDPAPATIVFVQMQLALQQLDQASKTSIVNAIGKAKVTVSPRYGAFDAKQVSLAPISPNWIKAGAASK